MSRAAATTAALLAVALSAACGASTAKGFDAHDPVAVGETLQPSATPTSASPKKSATPSGRYTFPADFKVSFPTYAGDGQEGVRAFADFWRAFWFSASRRGADQRYRAHLSDDSLMQGTRVFVDSVGEWAKKGSRPTGTVRVHQLKTISVEPARVSMAACVDESRMGAKSLSSGAVDWSLGKRKTSRYKMRIVMERMDSGWLMTGYMSVPLSEPAAEECR